MSLYQFDVVSNSFIVMEDIFYVGQLFSTVNKTANLSSTKLALGLI